MEKKKNELKLAQSTTAGSDPMKETARQEAQALENRVKNIKRKKKLKEKK